VADVFPSDIAVLKTYGAAPYANALKKLEKDIKDKQASVNEKIGVKVNTEPSCFDPL
jgi:26S proteasome regulatory subunit T1